MGSARLPVRDHVWSGASDVTDVRAVAGGGRGGATDVGDLQPEGRGCQCVLAVTLAVPVSRCW
jgi:hypothetical protein